MEPMYKPAGGLFACRRDVAVEQRSLHGRSQCGYVFPPERAVDIDTPLDLAFAEFLLQRQASSARGTTTCPST
jgi:CMP-N-acetylneuraminic acid synthetase